jgi:site-specific recombinase XerD
VLLGWRGRCPYNRHRDYIFASPDMDRKQPYWPTAGMEDHVRPAVQRAGITKRIGWHTLRHAFGTLVKSQGADVATTQSLMRHANVSVTMDRYVQAIGADKPEAQSRIVRAISFPNVPGR